MQKASPGWKDIKIRDCPFCGGTAIHREGEKDTSINISRIMCLNCPAQMHFYNTTREYAIGKWNTRKE